MRRPLLGAISEARDIEEAVVLTHNIDFVFLESMVMDALRKCGAPRLTVLADAGCAHESYAAQRPYLEALGIRYRVVPVSVHPGFRFHPKAVLLAGENSAHLYVGSGNLTYGGWVDNAEIWSYFTPQADGAKVFADFEAFVQASLAERHLGTRITEDIARATALARRLAPEPTDSDSRVRLLGRAGRGPAMLGLMLEHAPRDGAKLFVCSPYFDNDGLALQQVRVRFAPRSTTLLYHPLGSTLSLQALEQNPDVEIRRVAFQRPRSDGGKRNVFCHAKFYALIDELDTLVFSGSANCSVAALLAGGNTGNAELLVARRISTQEFESQWLGELTAVNEQVDIPALPPAQEDAPGAAALQIVSASLEEGRLSVVYQPQDAGLRECFTDAGTSLEFTTEQGRLEAEASGPIRWVRLRAAQQESAPRWVDDEKELAVPAKRNPVARALHDRSRQGSWDRAGWEAVARIFLKHATAAVSIPVPHGAQHGDRPQGPAAQISAPDVFASDYGVPRNPLGASAMGNDGSPERSLRVLLQERFHIPPEPEAPEGEVVEEEEAVVGEGDPSEPPRVPDPRPRQNRRRRRPETDRSRVQRILGDMCKALESASAQNQHTPQQIAADLEIAAILLTTAHGQGWITSDEFLSVTARAWAAAFIRCEGLKIGWLAARSAADPAFAGNVSSSGLSAALLGWAVRAMNCPPNATTCLVELVGAVAAARVSWIWWGGEQEQIARDLSIFLASSRVEGLTADDDLPLAEATWKRMLQRGKSLVLLDEALRERPLKDLRNVNCGRVLAGELLWQGPIGYCIALGAAPRKPGVHVECLKAAEPLVPALLPGRAAASTARFEGDWTVPVAALLCGSDLGALAPPARQTLEETIVHFRTVFQIPETARSRGLPDDDY